MPWLYRKSQPVLHPFYPDSTGEASPKTKEAAVVTGVRWVRGIQVEGQTRNYKVLGGHFRNLHCVSNSNSQGNIST